MATVATHNAYHDRRVAERRRIAHPAPLRADGMRVSWGGVFGGVLVALGFLLLMTALGVAVGIAAAQPGQTDTDTLGAGAGIWAGVSLLVALFIGGWVSTRIGAIFDGTTGFFEGALVWVVSVMLSGIGVLAAGAAETLGAAFQFGQATADVPWVTFGALLLSLLAAVLGAMGGRRNPLKEARA